MNLGEKFLGEKFPVKPATVEEAGRWLFQTVLGGLGMFRVSLSCPGGFSGSTWRVFGVNLTCYETHEIYGLWVFGVFRMLSRLLSGSK